MEKVSKRIFDEIGHDVSEFVRGAILSLDSERAPAEGDAAHISKLKGENERLEEKVRQLEEQIAEQAGEIRKLEEQADALMKDIDVLEQEKRMLVDDGK